MIKMMQSINDFFGFLAICHYAFFGFLMFEGTLHKSVGFLGGTDTVGKTTKNK